MSNEQMSIAEHLDELRTRLIRVIVVVMTAMVALFLLKDIITTLIFAPMQPDFITARLIKGVGEALGDPSLAINATPLSIINTEMAGQFNMHIKISLFGAAILSLPYILFELWLFLSPALEPQQRRGSIHLVWQSALLLLVGLAFGYCLIAPLAINFLGNYSLSESLHNMIEMGSYLSLIINLLLCSALIFELPLVFKLLARLGVVTSGAMRQYRRYAIAVIILFAAVITPPDVVSQLLIAIPLYIIYECSIGIVKRSEGVR